MPQITDNLKLFKWNTEDENDLEQQFDIDKAMNENWDKIDEAIEDLDTDKVDKVDGKGLSTNDFTNEDKEKLDGLENYDDTKIKQEIEDIQEEQTKQNEDIEDLKQINAKQDDLIQKLKDNSINVTTEEATQLYVTDASTVPAKLDVRGNQRQATREGRNRCTHVIGGLPKTYVSTPTGYVATNVHFDDEFVEKWQENGFTIKVKAKNALSKGAFTRFILDDTWNKRLAYSSFSKRIEDDYNIYESYVSNTDYNLFSDKRFIIMWEDTTEQTGCDLYAIEIDLGNTVGQEMEEYGASPSLDYPSEVRTVGDNVNIFDKDNANKINATPSAGTIIESSNGKSFYLEIKPNTDYSISRKIVGQRFTACTTTQVPAVGVSTNQNVQNNTGNEIHIKAGENDKYLLVYYLYNSSENEEEILSSIKVEEGEEATAYSPYGQGSVEVKKINKNFYKLDIEGVSRSGVDYTTRNGTVTAKRTATAESGSYFNTNRTKLPAGTYVISGVDDTFVYANARIEVYTSDTIDGNATQITTLMNTRLSYKYTSDKPFYLSFSFAVTGETDVNDTFIFKPQAEKNVATDFEEHKEQSLVLDIQKPMLRGDYFVKEADGWKEVHTFGYVNTREVENLGVSLNTSNGEFRRYNAYNLVTDRKSGEYLKILCTHFKRIDSRWNENEGICGWETGQSFCIGTFNTNYDTVDKMKTFLQQNDVGIYYELATLSKLACTEAQSKVLDQLSELDLFKGTNNIITAERLALIQMQYIADTVTYIDNRIDEKLANINQQILEIAGGN